MDLNNNIFQSIRWKLVSTYLILIIFTFVITMSNVEDTLTTSAIESASAESIAQSTLVASQLSQYMATYQNPNTFNYMKDIVEDQSMQIGYRVMVVDNDGKIIIDAYGEAEGKQVGNFTEISKALEGEINSQIYNHNDQSVMYTAAPIKQNEEVLGAVFLVSDVTNIYSNVNNTIQTLTFVFIMVGGMSIVVSLIFARFISVPIETMNESVKKITAGNYDIKLNTHRKDEIGELAESFNLMAIKLDQVDDSRRKFVSNVSHELRTPMTSMKIVCDTLLSQPHWEEEVYKEFLQDMNGEIDRLNKIIDDLLYLSKVEKKELTLEYTTTYVNYLIEKVIKRLTPIANKKDISIDFLAADKIQIDLDQDKMQQCLLNLIGNAVKYTPENGHVVIRLYNDREKVYIEIEDDGVGIPEKDVEHIFDRFYRVDEARHRKTGGTGLGLSIAQQVVLLHQGTISVSSIVDKGSKFVIEIPKRNIE